MSWKKVQYQNGKFRTANDSGGWGGSGHTYSTTEQDTGDVWIDGKHIYEKVFEFQSPFSVTYSSWVRSSIDSTNIETIINAFGFHEDGTYYGTIMADPGGESREVVLFQTGRNGNNASCKIILLQYTKINE